MKPDWKDAPEWAKWLARDQAGNWYWFEKRPICTEGCIYWFWKSTGKKELAGRDFVDALKEKRPDAP